MHWGCLSSLLPCKTSSLWSSTRRPGTCKWKFIIHINKYTTYILTIFYIALVLLHISMHPHNLQGASFFIDVIHSCLLSLYYFDVCTVHLVQFITQTKKMHNLYVGDTQMASGRFSSQQLSFLTLPFILLPSSNVLRQNERQETATCSGIKLREAVTATSHSSP